MNSHCEICDIEDRCGYEYKPCDCCNYRKFKPKADNGANAKASINTEAQQKHEATRTRLRLVTG